MSIPGTDLKSSACERTRISIITLKTAALVLLVAVSTGMLAQTVASVYSFPGQNGLANPFYVTPTQGRDGKLYGTTYQLTGGNGSVFRLATGGAVNAVFPFNGSDGSNPLGNVTMANDGNFYGTASSGGSANDGVLFKVMANGISVLHEFAGGSDGMVPVAAPIQAFDGNLYGTTFGSLTGTAPTVYKYVPSSGAFTTIYQFDQTHGQFIFAPLIQATDGNLYGTASVGGVSNCGTLFKLTTSGNLVFSYSFPCGAGGQSPLGPLVQASDGNFYGTTQTGGNAHGYGIIFKMDTTGAVSILHTFAGGAGDGAGPDAGLMQATDGNLYGVTVGGGKANLGALFQITLGGEYKLLYTFTKAGNSPQAAPVQHTNGLLYGTTELGGRFGFGEVYSVDMGLAPFVTFVRSTGKAGSTAQILGQGFTGTTAVTFNGVAATSFKVVSDTFMTAVVPSGATTGPVVVTTSGGPLTSNVSFRITP